jgi:hypothetical protein
VAELCTILTALAIDEEPLACEHGVLVALRESSVVYEWTVSLLGLRARDVEGLAGRHRFSALGSRGERFSGTVQVAAHPSRFHVRLEGVGPLRRLAAVSKPSQPADGPSVQRRDAKVRLGRRLDANVAAHDDTRPVGVRNLYLVHQSLHEVQPATVSAPHTRTTPRTALSEALASVLHAHPDRLVLDPGSDGHAPA